MYSTRLKEYLFNNFILEKNSPKILPFISEKHIISWLEYIVNVTENGFLNGLRDCMPQLSFPIKEGISQSDEYISATRRGGEITNNTQNIKLVSEETISIKVHKSPAGEVPIIIIPNRADFESVILAITSKNEPGVLSKSMGASMIAGYNNWDRIKQYKINWLKQKNKQYQKWGDEFLNNLIPNKALYQDRFILLSKGPYSNISHSNLELNEKDWLDYSLTIRLEHECNHYFTKRFFGTMRNNMHDELLADYMGITAALGYFNPDWFLHFIGLEGHQYREGARLQNYLGDPPLNNADFLSLQKIMHKCTENVYRFDTNLGENTDQKERTMRMLALSQLSLLELSKKNAEDMLLEKLEFLNTIINWN